MSCVTCASKLAEACEGEVPVCSMFVDYSGTDPVTDPVDVVTGY